MTRFTPCTLQISLSTALTASSLHPFSLTSPSGYCLIQMCYPPAHHRHHPPLHASIHCLFLCQCVFFSSIESRARYVNEVNRIVACGEAAQLSQKFPVHFTLIQSAVVLSFWCVCMYVCACRDTRCVCVFCLCLRVWMRSSPSAALPAVWQKLAIIIFAALPPSAAGINVGQN